ncbi:MAG: NAD(P)-dependent oxidoreductase [Ktedonobacteraceae bacterium]|nr:NAD(P)-dependent oxidoreductase [Ktedonobacteraceae bacterium]
MVKIQTVGIISPGDMGHAIGAVLRRHEINVITNLQGRSARSVARAKTAGISDVASDDTLVREADLLLSILPPDRAYGRAEQIAEAVRRTGSTLIVADCNAIAPRTAQAIDRLLTEAGAHFVDVGIIGGPPSLEGPGPRLYASGTHAAEVATLSEAGLDVRVLGAASGQASGLKMCYASLTKGLTALATEALVAGQALGLQETLLAEFQMLPVFRTIERSVPNMPPKAYRWVGEMEEISRTFSDLGLPPQIHEGAASLYRFIEGTVLGAETIEQRQHGQTLEEVVSILAAALGERQ